MSDACNGPACAFNMTYVTAALLGFYAALATLGAAPDVATFDVLVAAGIALLAARELWTRPTRLWWRSLVGGIVLVAALAFVGGLVVERAPVEGEVDTILVVAALTTSVLAPRALARSRLGPGRSRDAAG